MGTVEIHPDGLHITDDGVWTWVRLPQTHYPFQSEAARLSMVRGPARALAALGDAHLDLRTLSREYPLSEWAQQRNTQAVDPAPQWFTEGPCSVCGQVVRADDDTHSHREPWTAMSHLVSEQLRWSDLSMHEKVTFLGVRVADLDAAKRPRRVPGDGRLPRLAWGVPERAVVRWRERADHVQRLLASSALGAEPATADDLTWMHRHAENPSATVLPVNGGGWAADQAIDLFDVKVEPVRGRRVVRLEGPRGTCYGAVLCAARFPDVMRFPEEEPWALAAEMCGFPVEWSWKLQLRPPRDATRDAKRKLAQARDMDEHIRESGQQPSLDLQETLETARQLEHGLRKKRLPLVYGYARLLVFDPDPQVCDRKADEAVAVMR